jgi:voltage-dependent calcium channel alpha-2/delta-3
VLNSLVQIQVFKKIKVYDYQAICLESANYGNPASIMLTPFRVIASLFNWVIANIAFTIIRFELHHLWNPDWTYSMPQFDQKNMDPNLVYDGDYYAYDDEYMPPVAVEEPQMPQMPPQQEPEQDVQYEDEAPPTFSEKDNQLMQEYYQKEGGPIPILDMTYINKTQPKPCDKEVELYELNEEALKKEGRPLQGILRNCHTSNCVRQFTVSMIPNTNLILVAADTTCPCYSNRISVEPTKVDYGPSNENMYC